MFYSKIKIATKYFALREIFQYHIFFPSRNEHKISDFSIESRAKTYPYRIPFDSISFTGLNFQMKSFTLFFVHLGCDIFAIVCTTFEFVSTPFFFIMFWNAFNEFYYLATKLYPYPGIRMCTISIKWFISDYFYIETLNQRNDS